MHVEKYANGPDEGRPIARRLAGGEGLPLRRRAQPAAAGAPVFMYVCIYIYI